ncbi:MAG: glycosyl hydrolase family 28 protein [Phycisphaerae bacterium]|nr:glycosyl hydrolase family 28 protein [Phycisphaerae bacterium]MDW8262948.1 glycosyl hydrolase family 28 protein [Phycisphaerales bacterium]
MRPFCLLVVGTILLLLLTAGCQTVPAVPGTRAVFDVAGFGAVGDGVTFDTVAFRHAIEACRQLGGGTVRVGPGTYRLQPLDLASGTTLLLDPQAELVFSDNPDDYPLQETRWDGIMRPGRRPAILADGLRNVAIVGGTIDGSGARWWIPVHVSSPSRMQDRNALPASHPWETDPLLRRPPLVQFHNCAQVRIAGVTFRNPPMTAVHVLFSRDVQIEDSTFQAPEVSPGTDGVVIDSSSDVRVEDCTAEVGGEAFALRSGRDEDGRRIGRPTSGVVIRNCTVDRSDTAIAIGPDMSGGVAGVRIVGCRIRNSEAGVAIRSMRGRGGVIHSVRVEGVQMQDVGAAFAISKRSRPTAPEAMSDRTPDIRAIHVRNLQVRDAARAGIIEGLEELPVRELSFREIDITARYGISCSWAQDVEFRNVVIATDFGPAILRTDTIDLRLDNWSEATRPLPTQPAEPVSPATIPVTARDTIILPK